MEQLANPGEVNRQVGGPGVKLGSTIDEIIALVNEQGRRLDMLEAKLAEYDVEEVEDA